MAPLWFGPAVSKLKWMFRVAGEGVGRPLDAGGPLSIAAWKAAGQWEGVQMVCFYQLACWSQPG